MHRKSERAEWPILLTGTQLAQIVDWNPARSPARAMNQTRAHGSWRSTALIAAVRREIERSLQHDDLPEAFSLARQYICGRCLDHLGWVVRNGFHKGRLSRRDHTGAVG